MIKAVIFDMDGVIADSERFNIRAELKTLEQCGVIRDRRQQAQFLGTTHHDMWNALKKQYDLRESIGYYIDQTEQNRKKLIDKEGMKPMPGVVSLIRRLCDHQIPIAVASGSSMDEIRKNLSMFGVLDYFQALTSGWDCTNGKPDPEIYLWTARKLGVNPRDCAVIEDSTNGIRAAKAAGMYCIAYAPPDGIHQEVGLADRVIQDFDELR